MPIELAEDTLTLQEAEAPPAALPAVQSHPVALGATPADLLLHAMNSGADLDRLERLMALKREWDKEEAANAYNAAFAAFKAEGVTSVIKDRTIDSGPLKGVKHTRLSTLVDVLTPYLSKHGLSSSWKITKDEPGWIEVTCYLKHVKGHFETAYMGGPPDHNPNNKAKNPIQERISTVTYLERHTFKAVTGTSERNDDDDGGQGSGGDGGEPQADPLLQKGRDAAMSGTEELTKWWGSLTPKQQKEYNKDFGALRKTARESDGRAAR